MKRLLEYKSKDPTTLVLLYRLREQHEGLIRPLIVTPNGTNNFVEQELPRTKRETFFPSLAASLRAGFANS